MRKLHTAYHTEIENKTVLKRLATRAIALRGQSILLLYTQRYEDYSLPGGGLDEGEELIPGLIRELKEETGAQNISNIKEFGVYQEFRPWYKPEFDILHMFSYCFTCSVDEELGTTRLEDYEIRNGMDPRWVNINTAISHNERVILESDRKGLSIERETFLLRLIREELIDNKKK